MNRLDEPVLSVETRERTSAHDRILTSRVRLYSWIFLAAVGLVEAVFGRYNLWADGISYVDMGDALLRGDWAMGINAYWSPLYPVLQGAALRLTKPAAFNQFFVVAIVDFLIYLFALACFDFLLRAATRNLRAAHHIDRNDNWLPDWAVFAIGYAVFFWSSLTLITMQSPTPDILMAGFLYLAAGLMLQVWAEPQRYSYFALLGVVLGLGYLAKAAVFPLAFVLLALSWLLVGNWRNATPRVLVAAVVFLAICAPWIAALSHAKNRFTFGDTGRFNYLREVNHALPNPYFQNTGTGTGRFLHPVRQIFDHPPVFEFATPVKGTLPVWYDPSYWSEGGKPRVSLRRQLAVIHRWLLFYVQMLFPEQLALICGFGVLCWMAGRRLLLAQFATGWPVWLIGLVGLGMYALVYVEPRYVAAFFTLVWVGLFAGLKMPRDRAASRTVAVIIAAVALAVATPTALTAAGHLAKIMKGQPHNQWQVSEDLRKMGVMPGDRVARIGGLFNVGWARLLGVTIVADVPRANWAEFWNATPEVQAQVIEAFRRLGATAVVAEQTAGNHIDKAGPEWRKLGDGTFYALKLSPADSK